MLKFIIQFLIRFTPIIGYIIFSIIWDPFYIFGEKSKYIKNGLFSNREFFCKSLLEYQDFKKNNFIIGSSRSHAFKVNQWSDLLGVSKSRGFHFDGYEMGLFRALNVIKYLDQHTNKMDNILLIVDHQFFTEQEKPNSLLKIQPPELSSESKLKFYSTFIMATFNLDFIWSEIKCLFNKVEVPYFKCDILTGDIYYNYLDLKIKNDSTSYYNELQEKNKLFAFYERTEYRKFARKTINYKEYIYLCEIYKIMRKNNCNIKIVISPLYDQKEINISDLEILKRIFGPKNIFNYSGKNEYTELKSNYYENSHFKQNVAFEIIKEIYKNK